jgi:hypothetical protein
MVSFSGWAVDQSVRLFGRAEVRPPLLPEALAANGARVPGENFSKVAVEHK